MYGVCVLVDSCSVVYCVLHFNKMVNLLYEVNIKDSRCDSKKDELITLSMVENDMNIEFQKLAVNLKRTETI